MLFHVRMDVALPHDLDPAVRADLLARERARALELQRAGAWVHLWRVVGHYANISVFDVPDGTALHELLWSLPLFPHMAVEVTALTAHPSALPAGGPQDAAPTSSPSSVTPTSATTARTSSR